MSTERQILANRINGAKSHGPITPDGKLASSRNSTVHGLLADAIVLDGESAERFTALHDSYMAKFEPRDPVECALVENMVVCRWRQMRIWVYESASLADEMNKNAVANESESKATQGARAFRTLTDETRSLDSLNRYETRYDRQYSRCLQRLHDLQVHRPKPVIPEAPETKI